jgi:beta-glucanase (GH16 family)
MSALLACAGQPAQAQTSSHSGCEVYLSVPACPVNPPQKPGFYLLLDQSFQDPAKYWNVSKPNDDAGCTYGFMCNPSNVTFQPGAGLWNTNVPVGSCPFSRGEIKTMTVDTANHTFKSYFFQGSGYFEARIRQRYASPGQGSAMWLWSIPDSDDPSIVHPFILDDNEIDVFETQPNDSLSFNIGYHWRKEEDLEKAEDYYRIHADANPFTGWTVFAVHWCSDSISWFINNKKIITLKMDDVPRGCTSGDPVSYMPPDAYFCIRFNSGPNTVGPHDPVDTSSLPSSLEIDYVRMYKQDGEKAAPIKFFAGTPNQICADETSFSASRSIVMANYYPDAAYTWSSPAFDISAYEVPGYLPQHHSGKVKLWLKPGIPAGGTYPVILQTNVLSHSEIDTAWYTVCAGPPDLPSDAFVAVLLDGPLCLYGIRHALSDTTASSAEYYNDKTLEWEQAVVKTEGGTRFACWGRFGPDTKARIVYREKNACGTSAERISEVIIPLPEPGSCGW